MRVALLIAALALTAACGAPSRDSTAAPTFEPRCDFPASHPTYLPWHRDGEIPAPLKEAFAGYSKLVWPAGIEGAWQDGYVALWVTTMDGRVPGRPIGVVQWGREGVLTIGATKVSIFWQPLEDGDVCNTGTLVLKAPPLSMAEATEELLRVARSMPPS